jgi:MoaA/NifB/PqqE/SkfB family radical SAM enzyme
VRALRALRAYGALATALARANLGGARPIKATVVLTERCDCRCEICWIWKKPKGPEPTAQDVARFLRGARTIRWLNLTGGEIFLRDDVAEVVERALEAEPRLAVVDFPTTGQRTERILPAVERAARLGVPRLLVTVSVEGPPALHDRLRGRPGAFDRAVATYEGLRRMRGVSAYLGLTLSDRNAHAVDATLDALAARLPAFSAREVHANVATWSGHYYDNLGAGVGKPGRPRAAARRILSARRARWVSLPDLLEAAYLSLADRHVRTGRSPVPCRSLFGSVFVAPSGVVHPCTVFDRPLGNAWTTPLPEILAGPKAADARGEVAADRCPGCWSPCEAYPTMLGSVVPTARALLAPPPRGRPAGPAKAARDAAPGA